MEGVESQQAQRVARLSGLAVGEAFVERRLEEAQRRLESLHLFGRVEVNGVSSRRRSGVWENYGDQLHVVVTVAQ